MNSITELDTVLFYLNSFLISVEKTLNFESCQEEHDKSRETLSSSTTS